MNLDVKTLEILKNFNMINPSILFKPGNVISTVSTSKTILAHARIEHTIPREFAIYDLSKFIGVASIMQDCDIEFDEKQLYMKKGSSVIKYSYTSPTMITASPYKEIPIDESLAVFDLQYSTLSNIVRAASVLELPDITIFTEDGAVFIQAGNEKDNTTNSYRIEVCKTDNDFKLSFKVENLKLLNRDYLITIPSKGQFVHFKSSDISYWIAASMG